jgi:hypothetical protein
MEISMSQEQHEFVLKYQKIYDRLALLESKMQEIQLESQALLNELETLREEERTKFKTEE